MGTATLVATGIALVLLVVTAYVLVDGTTGTAVTLANAQSEVQALHEKRIRTSISILSAEGSNPVYLLVENTGSETVSDFDHIDVFVIEESVPERYPRGTGAGTWQLVSITPDLVHPNQLDPGEIMNISIEIGSGTPLWVQLTTGNGVSDSYYLG